MKVGDITAALEVFAPLRIQKEWDNSGLLFPHGFLQRVHPRGGRFATRMV